jgi:YjbE family integral membrane protein
MDTQFWTALLQIIGINIILSGDNAVVIALACRSLPARQRNMGIMLGAGAAVILRILFTVIIAWLLTVPYLKIAGGLLLLWVGYKLMVEEGGDDDVAAGHSLWHAVQIILVADAVMSLDNVIAVAAAAKGNYALLILGLLISVPLVVYGATLLIKLINQFPVIVPGGAALIGFVSGEVIVGDPVLADTLGHSAWAHELVPLLGALGIVAVGRIAKPVSSLPQAAAEATVGATAVFGLRLALQVLGRIVVARAPLIVVTIASYFGYTLQTNPDAGANGTLASILQGLRPIFAAVIAIALGEVVAWVVRRMRGPSQE